MTDLFYNQILAIKLSWGWPKAQTAFIYLSDSESKVGGKFIGEFFIFSQQSGVL